MHKVEIANILLTRKCNLKCEYCDIVKDYSSKPAEYPNMSHYHQNEKTSEEWIDAFDRLHENNPSIFFILYGGEPFMYPGLTDIVRHFKTYNYNHTIISNNTPQIQPLIKKLYDQVGILPGFSSSVDPELAKYIDSGMNNGTEIAMKTIHGFNNLKRMKTENIAKDVVAEITCTASNISHLYRTVQLLSENGIYSDITVLDIQKSPYYDFSCITDASSCVQKTPLVRSIFDRIIADKKLLVHMPEILNDIYDILPYNLECDIYKDVHNVSIDADATFRLCLRCKGVSTPKISVTDGISSDGVLSQELISALESDYKTYCKQCNHPCLIMSKNFSSQIVNH